MAEPETTQMALSPYRILDLADGKGAYASKVMADLGADVIRIEPPEGDPMRKVPPFVEDIPHPERSLYWLYRNANKRGVTLNLETEEGRDIFKRLVKTADILFETFEPGYLEKIGLDYPALKAVHPGLIHVSITNFGHTGPYAHYKASPLTGWAMSAGMYSSGYPDRPPLNAPGQLAYDAASAYAAAGAMLALWNRIATGEGQYVDIAMHEAAMAALVPWSTSGYGYNMAAASNRGFRTKPRMRQLSAGFACRDGYIAISLSTPRAFEALFTLLDHPEEFQKPPLNDIQYLRDMQFRDPVGFSELLYKYLQHMDKYDIFYKGQALQLPCWPTNTPADFVEDPHHKARGFWLEVEHPEHGKTRYPGAPWKLGETPVQSRRAAPRMGEHNLEIYGDELGLSADEISSMRNAGII